MKDIFHNVELISKNVNMFGSKKDFKVSRRNILKANKYLIYMQRLKIMVQVCRMALKYGFLILDTKFSFANLE